MRDILYSETFRPYNLGLVVHATGLEAGGGGVQATLCTGELVAAGGGGAQVTLCTGELVGATCRGGGEPRSGLRTSARGRRKGRQTSGSQTSASGSELVKCPGGVMKPSGAMTRGCKSMVRPVGASRVVCSIHRAFAPNRDAHALATQAPAAQELEAQAHGTALARPAPTASAPAEQRPMAQVPAAHPHTGRPKLVAAFRSFCSACETTLLAPT